MLSTKALLTADVLSAKASLTADVLSAKASLTADVLSDRALRITVLSARIFSAKAMLSRCILL